MSYAKEAFYNKEHPSALPCGCETDDIKIYFGSQHVYSMCQHGTYILLSDYKTWDKLSKDQKWIGPAQHNGRE